jgi:hypothetical protein
MALYDLPFIAKGPEGSIVSMWKPVPDSIRTEAELGRYYGYLTVKHIRDHAFPPLLGLILKSFDGSFGIVETSFCHAVGDALVISA